MDIGLILVDNYFADNVVAGVDRGRRPRRAAVPQLAHLPGRRVDEGMWLEHSSGYQRLATNLLGNYIDFTGINDAGLNSCSTGCATQRAGS